MEFWPVVCFVTGPTRGGLWRYVRDEMLELAKRGRLPKPVAGFMTQVLHFLDFNVTEQELRAFLSRGFREIFDVRVPIFADSGGFKFKTSNMKALVRALRKTGFRITRETVFRLQRWYGAELVASLDFPILPSQPPPVRHARMRVNIENAVWLVGKVASLPAGERPIPVLAVHGGNLQEVREYVGRLLGRIAELSLDDVEIRFAVGTYSNNGIRLTAKAVALLRRMVQDKLGFRPWIHVFGYSGKDVWRLVNAGAASFDSNRYVVSAKYVKWLSPSTLEPVTFYDATQRMLEECGCPYCAQVLEIGLERAKRILKSKRLAFSGFTINGEKMHKYHLYGLIAMHNLFAHSRFLLNVARPQPPLLSYIR